MVLAGLALVAGVLTAGCLANDDSNVEPAGTATSVSTPDTTPIADACTLVTAAEAVAALGEKVTFAESSSSTDGLGNRSCVFKAAAAGSKRLVEVRVIQNASISTAERKKGTTAASEFEKARVSFAKRPLGATPVANAGDSAFWNGTRLYVLKQDVLLTLLVGDEAAGNVGATTPLARSAAKRIK